jgi:hypothetical protein
MWTDEAGGKSDLGFVVVWGGEVHLCMRHGGVKRKL